ncbi:MAG: hypothetical protein JNJ90_11725 [Saprospiraceae bacterium]|nr:hypothetical protein [Saprospiraceae bacterium]
MGFHLKQTNKELIFVQDEVRGMKQTKGTLEVLLGVVGFKSALYCKKDTFYSKYLRHDNPTGHLLYIWAIDSSGEQLRPTEFEQLLLSIWALNACRKFKGLLQEESLMLKKINREFLAKKWNDSSCWMKNDSMKP